MACNWKIDTNGLSLAAVSDRRQPSLSRSRAVIDRPYSVVPIYVLPVTRTLLKMPVGPNDHVQGRSDALVTLVEYAD